MKKVFLLALVLVLCGSSVAWAASYGVGAKVEKPGSKSMTIIPWLPTSTVARGNNISFDTAAAVSTITKPTIGYTSWKDNPTDDGWIVESSNVGMTVVLLSGTPADTFNLIIAAGSLTGGNVTIPATRTITNPDGTTTSEVDWGYSLYNLTAETFVEGDLTKAKAHNSSGNTSIIIAPTGLYGVELSFYNMLKVPPPLANVPTTGQSLSATVTISMT